MDDIENSDEPFSIRVDVADFGIIDPGNPVAPNGPDLFVGPSQAPSNNWLILLVIGLIVYFAFGGLK